MHLETTLIENILFPSFLWIFGLRFCIFQLDRNFRIYVQDDSYDFLNINLQLLTTQSRRIPNNKNLRQNIK